MQMQNLAQIFITIQNASNQVDEIASQIIDSIRDAQADTLDDFNEMVSDAYEANGWSRQVGRPPEDSPLKPAPRTIQNYVWIIRSAFKAGIDVIGYDTMNELRKAVRANRVPAVTSIDSRPVELKGLSIKKPDRMTGALWHDLVVVWDHLPDNDRETLEEKLVGLLSRFAKKAGAELKAA